MRFANPFILLLLLPAVPGLVVFFWWSMKRRRELMTQFVQARLLQNLSVGVSSAVQKTRFALLLAAISLLVVAVARPQWGYHIEEVKQKGLDIVVAIDTSKSMLAEDIAPNRLARAKLAALDLIQQAKSDRVGLVAFAGSAFLQCPLTLDDVAFKQSLDTLDVNIIPQGGTALAEAIETATTAFKADDNYKILVLFTDGEDNDAGAVEAATKAAAEKMKIYPVGIGTPEGELLRIKDAKGRSDYIRDTDGSVVKSRLNERLLQEIARAGNGVYLRLSGAKTVETLYEKAIAPLPKRENAARLARKYHEQFFWPLGLAILFLIIEMFLPERKRERSARAAERRATSLAATVLILAVPLFTSASPSSALRNYEGGNFNESLKEYHRLLEKKPSDARLRFNAGSAAYRNREFNEAAKQFNEALSAQDLQVQQRAYYNLGNTLYQLGETAPETNSRMEQWTNSLHSFQNALALNSQDADAKFNHEFVKRKLEELQKQQQQQQQSQNQNKQDQNKDQQSKNDSQGKQDQQKNEQQQNQQEQAKQDQQQQKSEEQKQQEQSQASQQQKEKEEKEKQSAKSSSQDGEKSNEQQQAEAQPVAAGQMTEQQAKQLLDAQKGHEQVLIFKPTGQKDKARTKTLKDW